MNEIQESSSSDRRWMQRCLHLARRAQGRSWPNPPVACVLVRAGQLVGSGRTARRGRPHAETVALASAGALSRGATAYVTLEPCSHTGKTPPCADALVEAGVQRCVISLLDPNPLVSGAGVARMRRHGVKVETGLLADATEVLLAGHASRMGRGRPWLSLKIAATLDGAVGGAGRTRRKITGERSRAFVEVLRTESDAVLTGIGTALADNPLLIPRNKGLLKQSPVRIVLDSRLRIPDDSNLVHSAETAPLWVVHGPSVPRSRCAYLKARGVRLVEAPTDAGSGLALVPTMERLSECGITRILAETGPRLSTTLLAEGIADEVIWLTAGQFLGRSGLNAVETSARVKLKLQHSFQLGDDLATVWLPSALSTLTVNANQPDCLERHVLRFRN